MTNRPFKSINTVADLETTADRLDNYFFTPGAMRFFNSRIGHRLFRVNGERGYFVTSERRDGERRYWTVRQYAVTSYVREPDGRVCDRLDIDRGDVFQKFTDSKGAERRAEELQGYAMIDPKSFDIDRNEF